MHRHVRPINSLTPRPVPHRDNEHRRVGLGRKAHLSLLIAVGWHQIFPVSRQSIPERAPVVVAEPESVPAGRPPSSRSKERFRLNTALGRFIMILIR
jgi:hypothetical protein